MQELVDLRMQHHIAQEIYRQQIMQRIPGMYHSKKPSVVGCLLLNIAIILCCLQFKLVLP